MYLALKEIAFMVEHRQELINEILDQAQTSAESYGHFPQSDVSNVRMCACILWDLAQAMETKPAKGEKRASSFTISPEMKAFLERAYAAGELTR
jgi:hypothetical protein